MPDKAAVLLRGFLLVMAMLALVAAIIPKAWQQRLLRPWDNYLDRQRIEIPRMLRDKQSIRVGNVLTALTLFALWWYLGTPAGYRMLTTP